MSTYCLVHINNGNNDKFEMNLKSTMDGREHKTKCQYMIFYIEGVHFVGNVKWPFSK